MEKSMSQKTTTQSIKAAFTYPFDDPNWKNKLAIGVGLNLAGFIIPLIPALFFYGYVYKVMKRAISGDGQLALPEWEDWQELLTDGLKLFGAGFIFSIPSIIAVFASYIIYLVPLFGSVISMDSGDYYQDFDSLLPLFGTLIGMAGFGISMIISMVTGAIFPAAAGHIVATDQFAGVFQVGSWWRIFRSNLSGFLVSFVVLIGVLMVFGFVSQILYLTIVLCCLMPFVTMITATYVLLVAGGLFGQAYRDGVDSIE
jgi:hypothetical protein